MSQTRSPSQDKGQTPYSIIKTYIMGAAYGNAALFIGHPAERLKVASQIHLGLPYSTVVRPIISSVPSLYTGFLSCVYRQNIKLFYRSILMSEMPHRVDDLNLNFLFGTGLKAFIAMAIDSAATTPPENIKTWQMRAVERTSIREAAKGIYHTRGCAGFFFGIQPTMMKSFPSWFYLFLGYHATKDKRQQQAFLATIFWATAASIPITMLTNPIDVIKTRMQATLSEKPESIIATGKKIIQDHGIFSLARGFPFRLVHKSLATATAYVIMDMSSKRYRKE